MPLEDRRDFRVRLVRGAAKAWHSALLRVLLRVPSWFYHLALGIRSRMYHAGLLRVRRLPVPVISVGNITAGGTGKTPMVDWLARHLRDMGRLPAVLSRGYGASKQGEPNDEALLLERNQPGLLQVFDADRARAGWKAVEEFDADCVVLDDGFQHIRLQRDLDIVLVDALDPFGGGRLLPAGALREPVTALNRAHIVILTRSDMVDADHRRELVECLAELASEAGIVQARAEPKGLEPVGAGVHRSPDWLNGKRVFAFCGIGNPTGFQKTLESLKPSSLDGVMLDDHALYPAEVISELGREAEASGAEVVVTTQKDAVKIGDAWTSSVPALALRTSMALVQGEELLTQSVWRVSRDG